MDGEVDEAAAPEEIGRALIRRAGDAVSLITYGGCVGKALQAADQLAADGIAVEVLDLRSLRPLDTPAVLASVAKTHRAVIVDEGWRTCSFAAEVSAQIMEGAFYSLDAPVGRVCSAEVPMPYAKHMEDAALPQVAGIVGAVRETLGSHG
jgi:pyruvate dehydrogenase E1 component beta subunit